MITCYPSHLLWYGVIVEITKSMLMSCGVRGVQGQKSWYRKFHQILEIRPKHEYGLHTTMSRQRNELYGFFFA